MSELDRLKEQLVYLRLWLGIVVVAEISLSGGSHRQLKAHQPGYSRLPLPPPYC
jgi:hypothetical protein